MITGKEIQRITDKYAQLVELEWLVRHNGHGPRIGLGVECELCCSLKTLRNGILHEEALAVALAVRKRLRAG